MLILTRREGESLTLTLDSSIDPATPAGQLFASGPVVITVRRLRGGMVRLGVAADPRLIVLRSELDPRGTAEKQGVRGA